MVKSYHGLWQLLHHLIGKTRTNVNKNPDLTINNTRPGKRFLLAGIVSEITSPAGPTSWENGAGSGSWTPPARVSGLYSAIKVEMEKTMGPQGNEA